ncbi:Hypothetical protein R9X50_00584400 [Acrodontium crateriforme]|uniref:AB hydrolase-1 domain-containing protein n=1 Tax=Acrodontium crateriforme TaxID=150365 RepID=A0AAQ3MCX6_9PEZI|nr:Hypothetical protein R9X50_00584400 [Acrodontium crateriforme]
MADATNGVLTRIGGLLGIPAEVQNMALPSIGSLATLRYPYMNRLLISVNMAVDKITPNDPRVKHQFTEVDGHKWHWLDAAPQGEQKGVVVLVHGYPDLSLAWRYQIPMLMNLGLRCIAIDCMGYGRTGASDKLSDYSFKNHATAIRGIAKAINAPKVILGGHDWGGMVVYRTAQWCADIVSHVFSVATPYAQPQPQFISTEQLVAAGMTMFGYQLQFGSEDQVIEKAVHNEAKIRKWLTGLYGGKPSGGRVIMTPEKGVDLSIVEDDSEIGMSPLLNQEELDYYVAEWSRNGVHGPCNWYRTRRVNYEEELELPENCKNGSSNQITQPVLFIQCLDDHILIPKLSAGMESQIPHLSRGEVKTAHWALWQDPENVNRIVKAWFEGVVFGGKTKM